jgi:hypothetical protein
MGRMGLQFEFTSLGSETLHECFYHFLAGTAAIELRHVQDWEIPRMKQSSVYLIRFARRKYLGYMLTRSFNET